ncbi:hypothetical protein [Geomicrobium sediminis]|uniref:LysM domain-containing protein n=1 Tax=Geomicrobium sediminis TaxID=1347788 RepID=A0ABS2PFG6_9BACL|nr:hypothetical protein [Geomicrobium sediminis]MBM7633726.1 hypothetical protein [Geomicrobium sediminis]
MKKWIWVASILLVAVAVYYDLSRGSLPVEGSFINEEPATADSVEQDEADHVEEIAPLPDRIVDTVAIEVESGQTLLTILEQLHEEAIVISIEDIKQDFETLNDGTEYEQLKAGEIYTFPIYGQ